MKILLTQLILLTILAVLGILSYVAMVAGVVGLVSGFLFGRIVFKQKITPSKSFCPDP